MKLLSFLDSIFRNKDVDSNDKQAKEFMSFVKSLTNLTDKEFQTLKDLASGRYSPGKETSKDTKSFLDTIERVYGNSFSYGENNIQTRRQLYQTYDEMDENVAYVSAALDIVSDDATQADKDGYIIKIISPSKKVQKITEDLIDDFEVEEKLAKWARLVAKYGDYFISLSYERGKGITKIQDNIYPSQIERRDFNGELIAFNATEGGCVSSGLFPSWDYVHFKHKGDISKEQEKNTSLSFNTKEGVDLSSGYGQSILRPAIKVYAQLRFVENMILLSRLTNSIRRNIFMINVGDVAPDKSFETIRNYSNLLKKNVNLDLEQCMYDSQKKTITYDEDIFIPVADPKNDVRIEQVGGDANISEQYDLEYLLNKLFSALKIPKAYLNYEQDLNARSTLVQLDIRYARSVSRLQQTLRGGLIRLAKINLALRGIDPEDVDLDIQLTPVSAIDSEAKREEFKAKLETAEGFWRLITNINDKLLEDKNQQQGNSPQASGGDEPADLSSFFGNLEGGDASSEDETEESSEKKDDSKEEDKKEEKKPINLEYASKLLLTEYMGFSKEEVDKMFSKDPEGTSEDEDNKSIGKTVKFRFVKSSDPDIHAPYPTNESVEVFERLRESLLSKKE